MNSSYVSYTRYGFEGTVLAVYGYDREPLECPNEFCFFKSPIKILQYMGMEKEIYWIDLLSLFAYFIVVRFLTFFILRWKLNTKMQ